MRSGKKARRIQMLVFGGVLLAASAAVIGFMGKNTISFYKAPSELVAGSWDGEQLLRVGGLVVEGSAQSEGATQVFRITDGAEAVEVRFTGVLPDLFREGQGIVAEGHWRGDRFVATEVLAKHDENYMPKEVAESLKEQGHWQPGS